MRTGRQWSARTGHVLTWERVTRWENRTMPELEDMTLEQLTENAPDGCDEVRALYTWSTNYDSGTGPFAAFLDLIGWSDDELGCNVFDWSEISSRFGYMELDYLADALKEYANRPGWVRAYVDALMTAEMAE